jgi:hypothetical protein
MSEIFKVIMSCHFLINSCKAFFGQHLKFYSPSLRRTLVLINHYATVICNLFTFDSATLKDKARTFLKFN